MQASIKNCSKIKMFKRNFVKEYNIGEKVFAKVRGYAPWPAIITDYNYKNKKYCVKFYGTGEIGFVYAKSLFIYTEENKKILINHKTASNEFFSLSVIEIESALRDKDMAGAPNEHKPAIAAIGPTAAKTLWKTEPSNHVVAEDTKNFDLAATWAAVSIKEEPKHQLANHVSGSQLRSLAALASSRAWAKQPLKEEPCAQEAFENRVNRAAPSTSSRSWTSMPSRILLTSNIMPIGRRQAKHNRKTSMILENEFWKIFNELQNSFLQRSAKIDRGLEILRELKELEVNKLQLLRNSDCVDDIRKLRKYVGQPKLWNLHARVEAKFKKKAKKVRALAMQIYARYMKFFGSGSLKNRWTEYCKQLVTYNDATGHLADRRCITMQESTYENLLTEKKPYHYYPAES